MSSDSQLLPPGSSTYDSDTVGLHVGDGTWDAGRDDFLLPNLMGLPFDAMRYNGTSTAFKASEEMLIWGYRNGKSIREPGRISSANTGAWHLCRHHFPCCCACSDIHRKILPQKPSVSIADAYLAANNDALPRYSRTNTRLVRRWSSA